MVKCCTVAAFIILGIVWVLLIVSYATYWKMEKVGDDYYSEFLYSAEKIKYTEKTFYGKASTTGKWSDAYKSAYPGELSIYKASLAFSILAWVVTSATLFAILLHFVGILQKIPIFPTFVKFFPILSLLFCIISVAVFCGVERAHYSDCKKLLGPYLFNSTICQEKSLFEVQNDPYYYRGPTTAWFTTLASAVLSLVGLLVILIGKALAV